MSRFSILLTILLLLNSCGSVDTIAAPTSSGAPVRSALLLATAIPSIIPASTPRSSIPPPTPVPATQTPQLSPTPRPLPLRATTPPQPQTLTSPITSLSFVDDQHGWLAVDDRILQTSDGGAHWATVSTITGPLELSFLSLTDGWLSAHGSLFRTYDGGTTWQPLATASSGTRWIGFGDAYTGWAYTKDNLVQTVDSGITWARAVPPCGDSEPSGPLQVRMYGEIWLICPLLGLAGIRPNTLYHSTDNGKTWRLVCGYKFEPSESDGLPTSGFAYAITFINADQGWVSTNSYLYPREGGYYGTLASTHDGGATWQVIPNTPAGEYLHLTFTSAQRGYLVGHTIAATTLYQTSDGGTTWQPIYQVPPGDTAAG